MNGKYNVVCFEINSQLVKIISIRLYGIKIKLTKSIFDVTSLFYMDKKY